MTRSSTKSSIGFVNQSLPYWADPAQMQVGEINQNDGGRGFYFEEPSGHFLEVITRPTAAATIEAA